MRVLVACEFSGIVREAFTRHGHDAWSVDYEATEIAGNHYSCDLFDVVQLNWDMILAFPPCTYLARSGARWHSGSSEQHAALDFVKRIMALPIKRICVENPIGAINSHVRKPDQIIQPWQFGHGETKATCLWLKNLPKLVPTNIVEGRHARVHREPPSPDRWKNRSRTLPGIAAAMAEQWGSL